MALMLQNEEQRQVFNESTRVKTEACDDTHSRAQRKTRAIWDSRIYIKSLLGKGIRYAPQSLGTPGTGDNRHPLQNPSQSPKGGQARSGFHCLGAKSRREI